MGGVEGGGWGWGGCCEWRWGWGGWVGMGGWKVVGWGLSEGVATKW